MRRYLVLGMVVLGAAVGYGSSFTQSALYASTSTLMVVPARVSETFVPERVPSIKEAQIARLAQMILSRTRLERMLQDMDLYREELQSQPVEEVVRLMRDNIRIQPQGDSIRVAFTYHEPQRAKRVAERLSSLLVEENMREREIQAENTNQFIDAQMDEARRRLFESQAQLVKIRLHGPVPRSVELDIEVLEARYRALATMAEDAKIAANLERRQIGETLLIIDAARVPERPVAQERGRIASIGAAIGLLAGLGIAFRRPRPRG